MCDEFCIVGEHSKCVEGLCCRRRTISKGVYGRFSVGADSLRKCVEGSVLEEDSFKGVCGRF